LLRINNVKRSSLVVRNFPFAANTEQATLSYPTQTQTREARRRRRIKNANSFSLLNQIREKTKVRRNLKQIVYVFSIIV